MNNKKGVAGIFSPCVKLEIVKAFDRPTYRPNSNSPIVVVWYRYFKYLFNMLLDLLANVVCYQCCWNVVSGCSTFVVFALRLTCPLWWLHLLMDIIGLIFFVYFISERSECLLLLFFLRIDNEFNFFFFSPIDSRDHFLAVQPNLSILDMWSWLNSKQIQRSW